MWTTVFAEDIASKLDQAKFEFSQYQKTQQSIYLQQAGNKLFSAVENYLMIKYNRRVSNYKSLVKLVARNDFDRELLRDAVQLHYFFYNAQMQMENFEAEDFFVSVLKRLESNKPSSLVKN